MDIMYEEQRSNAARAERTIFVKLINEPDSVIPADVTLAFQVTSRARLPPLLSPTPSSSSSSSLASPVCKDTTSLSWCVLACWPEGSRRGGWR